MSVVTILVVYITLIAFLIWVCVLADPNSETLGGRLNVLLTEEIPTRITFNLRRRLPSKVFDTLAKAYDYIVCQRNPILQCLYLLLFLGSFATYLYEGWGRIPLGDLALSVALVLACLASFVVACLVPAGTISPSTWERYDNYKPDNVIYVAGKVCPTCNVVKLARSKHCRLCGVCQSRFDHHCGWLNQCVGEVNYRHFLFFLALHSCTFLYGSSRLWGILRGEMIKNKLWDATFYSPSSRQTVGSSPLVVCQYLVVHEGAVCGVLALAFVMAIVLAGFLLYHLWLAGQNTTTNETFKWAEVRLKVKIARSQARRAHEASGGALPLRRIADPVNSYNISLYENLMEVLFPRSERRVPNSTGRKAVSPVATETEKLTTEAKKKIQ
ncbi:hypothetical protein NSK_000955 [Nannochloropsis salina CCMP1776]|uniref:Palmitoyltransferase n=1 Tax=Nannochloropsis salina CCMP1776 TaxID=1027361 RepID=A0A4D9D9B3_9STRA|nr:hypothetical protein NSK_000955 [Nannochloropsis salina CCMP1776]|eukprot:TFJ87604.1 hypothetical protein NSK_000955 [Nannochloropsis salina CCMP1776]